MTPLFAIDNIYWHFPILLVVFSLVYSASRHDRWDLILLESLGWGFRIGSFLVGVGLVLYVASSMPRKWPYMLGLALVVAAVYYLFSFRKKPTPSDAATSEQAK